MRVIDIPSFNEIMSSINTLPHLFMPSDHLMMVSDFLIIE